MSPTWTLLGRNLYHEIPVGAIRMPVVANSDSFCLQGLFPVVLIPAGLDPVHVM